MRSRPTPAKPPSAVQWAWLQAAESWSTTPASSERAPGQPRGGVERCNHVGKRGVVGRAREAVQREHRAVGGHPADRCARLDKSFEVRAHRQRPTRHDRNEVEHAPGPVFRPSSGVRRLGRARDGHGDTGIGLRVGVPDGRDCRLDGATEGGFSLKCRHNARGSSPLRTALSEAIKGARRPLAHRGRSDDRA
jgi:hypothetical protein